MKDWVRDVLTIIGFGWVLQLGLAVAGVTSTWTTVGIIGLGVATFAFALWMGMFDTLR